MEIICQNCGKGFTKRPAGANKYCSIACVGVAQRKTSSPERVSCKKCGELFEPSRTQQFRKKAILCAKCSGTRGGTGLSKERIIADVKCVIRTLGHRPTANEYRTHGKHFGAIFHHFGGFEKMYEYMGIRFDRKYKHKRESVERLIADIKRVRLEVGHHPSQSEYAERGQYYWGTIVKRLNKKYWDEVIVSCFNLSVPEAIAITTKNRWTKEMWEYHIKNFAKENKRIPTSRDIPRRTVQKIFGLPNLTELLKTLGVLITRTREKKSVNGVSDDALLNDLNRVSLSLGARPGFKEYKKLGIYNVHGVLQRFRLPNSNKRSWNGVLSVLETTQKELPQTRQIQSVKHLSHVLDPVRDKLKQSSVEAIKEFFQGR